jgi:hypothetical protein
VFPYVLTLYNITVEDSSNLTSDILAMTEYTVSIIILSTISLRPLLRKVYRVTTNSLNSISFFGTKVESSTISDDRRKTIGSAYTNGGVYIEGGAPSRCDSEAELTELEGGRIYKREEIIVTSAREDTTKEKERVSSGGVSQ